MKLRIWTAVLLTSGLLGAGGANSQSTTSAGLNPLDAVPEKMPFSTPYGTPISLQKAEEAIHAAIAEANKRGWQLNIAVVDSGGNLVTFSRMDSAQLASISRRDSSRTRCKGASPTLRPSTTLSPPAAVSR